MSTKKLTVKQKRFVEEFLVDLNATQAAIRAGYSVIAARRIAAENMTKPVVSSAINAALAERSKATGWNAEKVLRRLGEMADADVLEIMDDLGGYKPLKDWPPSWRRMVSECRVEISYERSTDGTQAGKSKSWDESGKIISVKIPDRLKIIESIGRHVAVRAYPTPEVKSETHIHLHAEITKRLQGALQRQKQLPAGEDAAEDYDKS